MNVNKHKLTVLHSVLRYSLVHKATTHSTTHFVNISHQLIGLKKDTFSFNVIQNV
jgi:hypothetical protein